ncbi:putative alpha-ketoglutarate-dependent dioxygenase ABH6 [Mycena indigotica]|uniref:Putative alpha-ketoglutarate-dependent dioxygenase ABH6 n=1 Tax=Mycena indigotica TaxID=2126181 RepID=A0A8H6SEL9_9AGAR|nr:putative alpha-ketoglutarate-dependent dioxygenase ABH6 [Mycena indigotica]KAF7297360.1 putative alpha-ketoglutarate-dependent dioxygenase ABH6 [Mycena indigotica]
MHKPTTDTGLSTATALSLSDFHIAGPPTVYYIPNFITMEEEQYLVEKIQATPQQRWKQLANRRLQLWGGELTSKNTLIAQAMPPFVESYPDIIARLRATGAFTRSPHGQPNHIIMNEDRVSMLHSIQQASDLQGIMPHEDGPAYFPVVATISLNSHSMFHYYRYQEDGRTIDSTPVMSVLLEPRSVVISQDSLYSSHLHAIQEVEKDVVVLPTETKQPLVQIDSLSLPIANWDRVTSPSILEVLNNGGMLERETRYSLTCRDVEKVVQLKTLVNRR